MNKLFSERAEQFLSTSVIHKKRSRRISLLRLVFFVLAAILIILLIKDHFYLYAFILLVISIILFGLLVNYHKGINNKFRFYQKLVSINKNEIKKLLLDIDEFEDASAFLSEKHPYNYDLDIFGKHSLYQLINRAETPKGKDLLAVELNKHFDKSTILNRQEAIRELTGQLDWRQQLHALALQNEGFDKDTFTKLVKWLKSDSPIKTSLVKKIMLYAYWLFFVVSITLIALGQISFVWIFSFNVISLIVLGPKIKYLGELTNGFEKANTMLMAKRDMIKHLEKKSFQSKYLLTQQKNFFHNGIKASRQFDRLSKIVDSLNNRANLAYIILNSFLLLDMFILFRAEDWKKDNQKYFVKWFDALAAFESIASFSGFAFANPDFCFPVIHDEYAIKTTKLGHPLIPKKDLVRNDFQISGKGAVTMITGSNMAGKSTFLRTVGINLVLAQSGAPVCATEFSFIPCQVFSSMRTKDNLEENISTFYAELLRIKALLESISGQVPTFYLLDEILKGTNSKDRHAGAEALIKQLNKSNSFGLVSTHDLELNTLEKEIPDFENYSFHSEVKKDEIYFDYKLKNGPCQTFNAVALMKKMGIAVG